MDATALSAADLALAGAAAVAAGLVNALAGGGTLVTFPTLTALGMPAVAANVTNTVALAPGPLGATLAQMRESGHPFILGSECDVLHVPEAAATIRRKVEVMLTEGA